MQLIIKYACFQSTKKYNNVVVSGNDLQIVCSTFVFLHTVTGGVTKNCTFQHLFLNVVTCMLPQLMSLQDYCLILSQPVIVMNSSSCQIFYRQ